MELSVERLLLELANPVGLSLLLPLGLILRSLNFTRKAGGTLIAFALCLYLALPLAILLSQAVCDQFISQTQYANLEDPTVGYPDIAVPSLTSDPYCNPYHPEEKPLLDLMDSIYKGPTYNGTIEAPAGASVMEKLVFMFVVRTLLMGIFALTLFITSIRVLGHLLGSEIDIWSIARFS